MTSHGQRRGERRLTRVWRKDVLRSPAPRVSVHSVPRPPGTRQHGCCDGAREHAHTPAPRLGDGWWCAWVDTHTHRERRRRALICDAEALAARGEPLADQDAFGAGPLLRITRHLRITEGIARLLRPCSEPGPRHPPRQTRSGQRGSRMVPRSVWAPCHSLGSFPHCFIHHHTESCCWVSGKLGGTHTHGRPGRRSPNGPKTDRLSDQVCPLWYPPRAFPRSKVNTWSDS